jgi:hypothetical protein
MKINICGHDYNLEYVDGLFINEGQWGKISNPSLSIDIDADLRQTIKGETLLHEILEGMNFWNNWNLEHHLLTQINTNYYSVLNNNKFLIKELFGDKS